MQTLANPAPAPNAFFGGSVQGFNGKQNIAASSDLIAVGSAQFLLVGVTPQDVYLYGRQNDGTFSQTDNIQTPEPGMTFPGFDVYGQSVTLSDDDELYIGQMSPVFEGGGRVFVYELQ